MWVMVAMSDPCQAQTIFGKEYPVGYNNISWVRGVGMQTGGVMVSARPTESTTNTFASSILTTDEVGNVVSLFRYEHGLSDLITCMERLSNGDIIVGSSSGQHFGGLGSFDMMLKRLDPGGNVIWSKALGSAMGNTTLYDMVEPVPGALIGVASVQDSSGAGYPLLFRLDGSGTIVWSHRLISTGASMRCMAITRDQVGGVIISGHYVDPSNVWKMLVVRSDVSGNVDWSHCYGTAGFSEVREVLNDPNGGFAIVGDLSTTGGGGVIRTDASGTPYSMFLWGSEIEAGHCFADRSLLLVTQVPGGNTGFARIDTNNVIQWSALLEATSWGELVPLYGSSRFAYVSSKMFSDVTITTLTDQLNACDGDTLATSVVPTWENHGSVVVTTVPLALLTLDIPITMVPLNTSMVVQCEEYVGVAETDRPAEQPMKCGFAAKAQVLSITGMDRGSMPVVVSDVMGRRWHVGQAESAPDGAVQLAMPSTLAPGYYVASAGVKACTFVVAEW